MEAALDVRFKTIAPPAFRRTQLVAEARAEGFRFLDRILGSIESGEPVFAARAAHFIGLSDKNELVAVGGLSHDPYGAPETTGRLRHLYIRPGWRRLGVGGALVWELLSRGERSYDLIRLRTDTVAAAKFYEAIGFRRVKDRDATHEISPSKRSKALCTQQAYRIL
ncbi:MAG: GNAT family N-acetyltransferase [Pseudomonadota bacterium]